MSSGNEELWRRGLRTRREVVGEAYVDNALRNGSSEFAFAGQQMVTEYGNCPPLFVD
jgi:4-carboxymuconolactone decarboxylase